MARRRVTPSVRSWSPASGRRRWSGRPSRGLEADFNLYLDEFQNYPHLPKSLDEVLVEPRGYHLSLVLANQHLGQLASPTREELASNTRTRVVFQSGFNPARRMPAISPGSSTHGSRSGIYATTSRTKLRSGCSRPDTGGRPLIGRTRPAADALGADHSERLIDSALERRGRSRDVVEVEIAARLGRFGFDDGSAEAAL
ncbi:MAG TPA: hypothetical protein VNG93_13875 [Candidatus Dormibacteraeota bacterium]|nr:hypothetical protein [Candidatus Dormibacteraeota bacterium]